MSRKWMQIGIVLQIAQAILCFSLMGIRWYFDMAPQWDPMDLPVLRDSGADSVCNDLLPIQKIKQRRN